MTGLAKEKQQGHKFGDLTPAAGIEHAVSRAPSKSPAKELPMTNSARTQRRLRVQILNDHGEADGLPITVQGRDAWALNHLIEAGERGCTAIDKPGPRWSHYVWKLRGYGLTIETIPEEHGGPFPGRHARYRLHSRISVIASERAAA